MLALPPVDRWLRKFAAKPEEELPLDTVPWVIVRAVRDIPPGLYDVPSMPDYAVSRRREDRRGADQVTRRFSC